jgi:hypothetical protein
MKRRSGIRYQQGLRSLKLVDNPREAEDDTDDDWHFTRSVGSTARRESINPLPEKIATTVIRSLNTWPHKNPLRAWATHRLPNAGAVIGPLRGGRANPRHPASHHCPVVKLQKPVALTPSRHRRPRTSNEYQPAGPTKKEKDR